MPTEIQYALQFWGRNSIFQKMTNSVSIGTWIAFEPAFVVCISGFGLRFRSWAQPLSGFNHLIFFRTMQFLSFVIKNLHSDPDSAKSPGSVSGISEYGYEGLIQTLFSSTQSINSTSNPPKCSSFVYSKVYVIALFFYRAVQKIHDHFDCFFNQLTISIAKPNPDQGFFMTKIRKFTVHLEKVF